MSSSSSSKKFAALLKKLLKRRSSVEDCRSLLRDSPCSTSLAYPPTSSSVLFPSHVEAASSTAGSAVHGTPPCSLCGSTRDPISTSGFEYLPRTVNFDNSDECRDVTTSRFCGVGGKRRSAISGGVKLRRGEDGSAAFRGAFTEGCSRCCSAPMKEEIERREYLGIFGQGVEIGMGLGGNGGSASGAADPVCCCDGCRRWLASYTARTAAALQEKQGVALLPGKIDERVVQGIGDRELRIPPLASAVISSSSNENYSSSRQAKKNRCKTAMVVSTVNREQEQLQQQECRQPQQGERLQHRQLQQQRLQEPHSRPVSDASGVPYSKNHLSTGAPSANLSISSSCSFSSSVLTVTSSTQTIASPSTSSSVGATTSSSSSCSSSSSLTSTLSPSYGSSVSHLILASSSSTSPYPSVLQPYSVQVSPDGEEGYAIAQRRLAECNRLWREEMELFNSVGHGGLGSGAGGLGSGLGGCGGLLNCAAPPNRTICHVRQCVIARQEVVQ